MLRPAPPIPPLHRRTKHGRRGRRRAELQEDQAADRLAASVGGLAGQLLDVLLDGERAVRVVVCRVLALVAERPVRVSTVIVGGVPVLVQIEAKLRELQLEALRALGDVDSPAVIVGQEVSEQ